MIFYNKQLTVLESIKDEAEAEEEVHIKVGISVNLKVMRPVMLDPLINQEIQFLGDSVKPFVYGMIHFMSYCRRRRASIYVSS